MKLLINFALKLIVGFAVAIPVVTVAAYGFGLLFDRYYYYPRNLDLSILGQFSSALDQPFASKGRPGLYASFATKQLETDEALLERAWKKFLIDYGNGNLGLADAVSTRHMAWLKACLRKKYDENDPVWRNKKCELGK